MPNSMDNQDIAGGEEATPAKKKVETAMGPALGNMPPAPTFDKADDTVKFTSDDQKGKKVDGDPELPSDQPIDQNNSLDK